MSPFAYSVLARALAQMGHPSFVVRLPFDLGARQCLISTVLGSGFLFACYRVSCNVHAARVAMRFKRVSCVVVIVVVVVVQLLYGVRILNTS